MSSAGLSPSIIAGIVIVCIATIALTIVIGVFYIRGKRLQSKDVENQSEEKVSTVAEISEKLASHGLGAPKPISRPHLTASVILPARAPLPPVPSAKKFPSGPASPHLVGFDPTDADLDYAPFSPAPFSPSGERPGSISIPRSSILASARKDSVGSFSSAGSSTIIETLPSSPITKNPDLLEVRTIFTPHLPDELVLCKGEKLTLIRSFDDGWCIVGRKSPFCVPIPVSPTGGFGKQSPVEDIEIGAVPKWVFESPLLTEKEKSRPSRTTSMAVNFVISDEPESY